METQQHQRQPPQSSIEWKRARLKARPTEDVGDRCDFCEWFLLDRRLHRTGVDDVAIGVDRVFRCYVCGRWMDCPVDPKREITHRKLKESGRVVPMQAIEEQSTIVELLTNASPKGGVVYEVSEGTALRSHRRRRHA